jgi:hypothetical protein
MIISLVTVILITLCFVYYIMLSILTYNRDITISLTHGIMASACSIHNSINPQLRNYIIPLHSQIDKPKLYTMKQPSLNRNFEPLSRYLPVNILGKVFITLRPSKICIVTREPRTELQTFNIHTSDFKNQLNI